jgi:hypothetical protein
MEILQEAIQRIETTASHCHQCLHATLTVHVTLYGLPLTRIIHKTQSVPRRKHYVSVIKTSQLMLYREIIAVCSQIHTKHINTLCAQNVELLNA